MAVLIRRGWNAGKYLEYLERRSLNPQEKMELAWEPRVWMTPEEVESGYFNLIKKEIKNYQKRRTP